MNKKQKLLNNPNRCGRCTYICEDYELFGKMSVTQGIEWQIKRCKKNKDWLVSEVNYACKKFKEANPDDEA